MIFRSPSERLIEWIRLHNLHLKMWTARVLGSIYAVLFGTLVGWGLGRVLFGWSPLHLGPVLGLVAGLLMLISIAVTAFVCAAFASMTKDEIIMENLDEFATGRHPRASPEANLAAFRTRSR